MRDKFRKFDGQKIPDVVEYLRKYIEKYPGVTIAVGCDSIQKRRKTLYAITIVMYNTDIKNGAHVIFYRESHRKIRDNQERLYLEAKYLYDIGMFLDKELSDFYIRRDLTEKNKSMYNYHILKCDNNSDITKKGDYYVLKSGISNFRLVDIHVDFNPSERNSNGIPKNKSYSAYKNYVPWLRGVGFRTWSKPLSFASTTAADLLLKQVSL